MKLKLIFLALITTLMFCGNVYAKKSAEKIASEERDRQTTMKILLRTQYILKQTPETTVLRTPTKEETGRGYVLFVCDYIDRVYRNTVPKEKEIKNIINTFATPGEYEPITFAVYPLKDLGPVQVKVSDLTTADGSKISKENIDIRKVSYLLKRTFPESKVCREVPQLLEKIDTVDILNGNTQEWWLTVKVPENAKAGIYKGKVTVNSEAKTTGELAISFEVLPFKLLSSQETGVWTGVYAYSDDNMQDLADMREHGITGFNDFSISKTKNSFEDADRYMENLKKAGLKGPVYLYYGTEIAISPEFKDRLSNLKNHLKSANWPEVLIYPVDEPTAGTQATLDQCLIAMKTIKNIPGLKTYVTITNNTDPKLDLVLPYTDIGPYNPNRTKLLEALEKTKKAGKDFFWYNGLTRDNHPRRGRILCGLWNWKLNAKGFTNWHYNETQGDPFNDLDGAGMDAAFVYPSREQESGEHLEGIPTLIWETMREGIDDRRYIETLKSYITKANSSKDQNKIKAAAQAAKMLDEIFNSLPIFDKWENTEKWFLEIDADKVQGYRRQIADAIKNLH
ncbi:MAG: hypothetical protein A2252_06855 [Elusimicrobia bacterium RIFOXYA2_FULL_39_19]|nr:MAG: hypothetical protein A2252_06855 [Elusimicrobia bacterium RIFOXYA2_FULL_39_19]